VSAPAGPPLYKGEPLDADRGPGLGCFWIQVGLLTFLLVFTPLTVVWGWDPFISGALLIITLLLLLFTGQTIIFLLRLVAADRRTRRAPLDPSARPTVGQIVEREASSTEPAEGTPATGTPAAPGSPPTAPGRPPVPESAPSVPESAPSVPESAPPAAFGTPVAPGTPDVPETRDG
jgi:hypothetical protein